jgi:serine phosphatase RsbU (regulator of sigma subunit)
MPTLEPRAGLGIHRALSVPSGAETALTLDGSPWPLATMHKEQYAKGEYLFRIGDQADKLFLIHKGQIRLPELDVVVQPGQILGEMGLFSPGRRRTASAVSEGAVEAYTMGRDEVVQLFSLNPSLALELMQLSNKRFIQNLKAETEAKERIKSELRIAREIQASMLPRMFPDRTEFELYATMDAAEEVGGDFYDFFFVNPTKLCLVIGDVSGKGVPAALFMAVSKALLRSEAMRDYPPHEVLAHVNKLLCPDNQICMYVTVFCLMLDTQTGVAEYCNGGHTVPLVTSESGRVKQLEAPQGAVLGVMENAPYESRRHVLSKGDLLLLYTDGVTEAINPQHQLFSHKRLQSCLAPNSKRPVAEVVADIRRSIADYAQGQPQSDDITMLGLRFLEKSPEILKLPKTVAA